MAKPEAFLFASINIRTFPVIFLSFTNVKAASYEEMIFKISQVITDLYNENDYLLEGNLLNEKEQE